MGRTTPRDTAPSLSYALEREYPDAGKAWGWQYVFPASKRSLDLRSGTTRRRHPAAALRPSFAAIRTERGVHNTSWGDCQPFTYAAFRRLPRLGP